MFLLKKLDVVSGELEVSLEAFPFWRPEKKQWNCKGSEW
jgi:hypothetical protein